MQDQGRGGLDELPFEYRELGRDRVEIYWRGKLAATLKDNAAIAFLTRVARADAKGQQVLMAKLTGNFKRGNERRN